MFTKGAKKGISDQDVDIYRMNAERNIEGMTNYYRANLAGKKEGRWIISSPKFDLPSLIITGADDKALGLGLFKDLELVLTDNKVEVVENCSHWVTDDAPEKTIELIINLLKKNVDL